MRILKTTFPFLCFALAGCHSYVFIERNETIEKTNKVKVICIDPNFYYADNSKNYQPNKLGPITKKMRKDIIKFSGKNNIDLTMYDLGNVKTTGYYYELLNLKQNMLSANFNQRTPLNFSSGGSDNQIQQKVFVYAPRLAYEFAALAKEYNTPYFSFVGIYESQKETVLYHIIVNVYLSETVYREYRSVKGVFKKKAIGQMIYDSYACVNKNFSGQSK